MNINIKKMMVCEYYGNFNKLKVIDNDNIDWTNKVNFRIVSKYYLNSKIPEELIRKIKKYIFYEYSVKFNKLSVKKINNRLSIQKIFLNFKGMKLCFKFKNVLLFFHKLDCLFKFLSKSNSTRKPFYRFIKRFLRAKFNKNNLDVSGTKTISHIFPHLFFNNCIRCYNKNLDNYANKILKTVVISLHYIKIKSFCKYIEVYPIFKIIRIEDNKIYNTSAIY